MTATETEMVMRVGEAALEHMLDRRGIKNILSEIRGGDPEIWTDIVSATGRAALEAAKEPTEEMNRAGWRVNDHRNPLIGDMVNDTWNTMIDAALNHKGGS